MSRQKAKHYLVTVLTALTPKGSQVPRDYIDDVEKVVDLIMDGVKEEIKGEK